jgi:hypothetical protein
MSAKDDLDVLLNFVMSLAHPLIERYGEFYPFAAVLDRNGAPEAVSVPMPSDKPLASAVRAALTDALRARAVVDGCRAVALGAYARVTAAGAPESDAVVISMEHSEGTAVEVAVPYNRSHDGHVAYAATRVVRGTPKIFRSANLQS